MVKAIGGVPEWSKGSDCKSDGSAFEGSNPSPSTIFFPVAWQRNWVRLALVVGLEGLWVIEAKLVVVEQLNKEDRFAGLAGIVQW